MSSATVSQFQKSLITQAQAFIDFPDGNPDQYKHYNYTHERKVPLKLKIPKSIWKWSIPHFI